WPFPLRSPRFFSFAALVFPAPAGIRSTYRKSRGSIDACAAPSRPGPPDAPAAAEAPGSDWPAPGGQPGRGEETLRPAVLLLPPRRPVAHRPPPHLLGGGPDPHRLCAPGPARGGPTMGARTSAPQGPGPRDQPVDPGLDHRPRPAPPPPAGATLNIGPILAQTIGHFFPELNAWIDRLPDPRFLPLVIYHKRFLLWWGLSLFLYKLGS